MTDGSVTIGIVHDPQNISPLGPDASDQTVQYMQPFAYDPPLWTDAKGNLAPGLATAWKAVDPTTYTLTIRKGVTCADGTAMDAKQVAANINYVADPANKAPMIDTDVPSGAKATVDDSDTVVTIKLKSPNTFFLQNLSYLPMICSKGLADPASMTAATQGSGPYVLTQVVPNDHYTYTLRKGYDWGVNGATTAEQGLPATVIMKVVSDETTSANLLLSGQLNYAQVIGPDAARLKAAGLFEVDQLLVQGQLWFNQQSGLAVDDPAVRKALVMALDLPTLNKVSSDGKGVAPDGLVPEPKPCPGDTVTGNLPTYNVDGAKAALDAAGWTVGSDGVREKDGKPLTVTYLYADGNLPESTAAAEYIQQQWQAVGVKVTLEKKPKDQRNTVIFGDNNKTWDVVMVALQVPNAGQAAGFVSGTVPSAGLNFAHINNQGYLTNMTKGAAEVLPAACADWHAAEASLFKSADVVPFSNIPTPFWGKNITFQMTPGFIIPTSLRQYTG